MARRTKEEAEQTKQDILASAQSLFYEKGFARSTFDEVAKRINLTKGAVYWHFRNKADLLAELMRQKFIEHKEKISSDGSKMNSLSDIREHFKLVAQSIENDADFCRFLFFVIFQMEWSESVANRVFDQLTDITEYTWKTLKERLTFIQKSGEIPSNINVEDLTILISCLWRGTVDSYISKRYPMSLSVVFLQGFDMLINSLKLESK
ncbi:MAG: TetR family transcriptional regulator [Alphaproteobacteria bacterium]|nr:TetR family transcriptional regulator [Alphaproteobacteria bacterium]